MYTICLAWPIHKRHWCLISLFCCRLSVCLSVCLFVFGEWFFVLSLFVTLLRAIFFWPSIAQQRDLLNCHFLCTALCFFFLLLFRNVSFLRRTEMDLLLLLLLLLLLPGLGSRPICDDLSFGQQQQNVCTIHLMRFFSRSLTSLTHTQRQQRERERKERERDYATFKGQAKSHQKASESGLSLDCPWP